jgi:hypothetical protein
MHDVRRRITDDVCGIVTYIYVKGWRYMTAITQIGHVSPVSAVVVILNWSVPPFGGIR